MFDMKEEYRMNISPIDEQHEGLFVLMEKAYELLQHEEKKQKYEEIKDIIVELHEYAQVHFTEEEALMEKIGYSELAIQRHEHKAFIRYVHDFEMHQMGEDEDSYIMELLEFLYDWLSNHIYKKDMKIAETMRG